MNNNEAGDNNSNRYLEVRYPAFAFETLHYPWIPSSFFVQTLENKVAW